MTDQDFICNNLSLAPFGFEQREDNSPCFCTPKGAEIIGWGSTEGIHYCTVSGWNETVFAVNPSNGAPDYVHPLAENFDDFLRLLLACGDANLLEQAWLWDEPTFLTICEQFQPSDEAALVLSELTDTLQLSPMEHPWQYMRHLQQSFDYSKIKYSEFFSATDLESPIKEPYFDGPLDDTNDSTHLATKLLLNNEFEFAQHNWKVPAAYVCSQGLIIDACMQVSPQEWNHFIQTYALFEGQDFTLWQQMRVDAEHPFLLNLRPSVLANGNPLSWNGTSTSYHVPFDNLHSNDTEQWRILGRYHLDPTMGWAIHRMRFAWSEKEQLNPQTLKLTMAQEPCRMPGQHFEVTSAGDTVELQLPENKGHCTLTVLNYKSDEIQYQPPYEDGMEYPSHYTEMIYSLSPELPKGYLSIHDCCSSDQPREKQIHSDCSVSEGPLYEATIGIIGGIDGPTAICISASSKDDSHSACSALHFEPASKVEWFPVFQLTPAEPKSIQLL